MERLPTKVAYVLLDKKIDCADFSVVKSHFQLLCCLVGIQMFYRLVIFKGTGGLVDRLQESVVLTTCKAQLRLQDNGIHHVLPSGGISADQVSGSRDHMQNLGKAGMDAM